MHGGDFLEKKNVRAIASRATVTIDTGLMN